MSARRLLELIAALFALLAAVFWFLSAAPWEGLPQIVSYWGAASEGDPFWQAMVFSAKMNSYAASCSCIAAAVAGIRLFPG